MGRPERQPTDPTEHGTAPEQPERPDLPPEPVVGPDEPHGAVEPGEDRAPAVEAPSARPIDLGDPPVEAPAGLATPHVDQPERADAPYRAAMAEPAPPPPPPPAEPPRAPWLPALGGGIVGAALIAGLGWLLGDRAPAQDLDLAPRIAALDSAVTGLRSEIADQAARTAELSASLAAAPGIPAGTLDGAALAALRTELETGTREVGQRLSELDGRVGGLADEVGSVRATLTELGQRLDTVTGEAADAAVAQVEAALGEVRGALDEVRETVAAGRSELEQARAAIAATDEVAARNAAALAEVAPRLEALELVGERAARLALVVADAELAIERGMPLDAVQARLAELAASDPALEAPVVSLEAATAAPIPTYAELRAGLVTLQPEEPAAAEPDAAQDVLETAVSNVLGLVRVAPLDEATERRRAAIESAHAALDRNDVASARAAIAQLGLEDDPAVAAWLAKADQRLRAEQAIAGLRERLRVMLSAAG